MPRAGSGFRRRHGSPSSPRPGLKMSRNAEWPAPEKASIGRADRRPPVKNPIATVTPVRGAPAAPAFLREHLIESLKIQRLRHHNALRVCRKSFSRDAVHRLRVACRRVLGCLNLLRGLASTPVKKKDRRAAKRQLEATRKLRDVQVQLLAVARLQPEHSELKGFCRYLQRRERRLIVAAAKGLNAAKLAKRLAAVERSLARAPLPPAADAEDRLLAGRALTASRNRAAAGQRVELASLDHMHRSRLALKNFRYLMESLRPLWPATVEPLFTAMVERQRGLGELHDLDLLLARIDRFEAKARGGARGRLRSVRATLQGRRTAAARAYRAVARSYSRQVGAVVRWRRLLQQLSPRTARPAPGPPAGAPRPRGPKPAAAAT